MENTSFIFIIFGATGDLTKRKLLPAFYNLEVEGHLPDDFIILASGRRNYLLNDYLEFSKKAIEEYSRLATDPLIWEKFKKRIKYFQLDFNDNQGFLRLNDELQVLETKFQKPSLRLYYLAVAPEQFLKIVNNLGQFPLQDNNLTPRLIIEKPFGRDLTSATSLNKNILKVFKEENIYRIDHYLGKEMLQNIIFIRFANAFFEPLWNFQYIQEVEIMASETLGVGTRGAYYDQAGASRDMLQSHLLQLLALIAMEPPLSLNTEDIRNEKVRLLKSLSKQDLKKTLIRGQYQGYKEEKGVHPYSNTETHLALKTYINNKRWKGVPFYIRTGKMLKEKKTEIRIKFRKPNILYPPQMIGNNLLVFKIQPEEGVYLEFNAKKPGQENLIIPVKMDFCQNCDIGINTPEAYERLIFDILKGEQSLFARWDEVRASWNFVDHLLNNWENDLHIYQPQTNGPKVKI